jgi:hypothetical protein
MSGQALEPQLACGIPAFANGQKFLQAVAHLQAQAFQGMLRYQIETLTFLKHRCEQDLRLVGDMTANKDHNDAFDVVTDFMQRAMTEYTTEAGKIATISSKLSSDAARRMRKQANELIDDLAVQTVA